MNVQKRSAPHLVEQARRRQNLADLIEPDQVVYAARASNKQQLLRISKRLGVGAIILAALHIRLDQLGRAWPNDPKSRAK
jgi:hypothetical protein